jgi:hypothetical protein
VEGLANDVETTLAAAITTVGQTSITVASNSGFPAANFRVRIDDELLLVTANPSTSWTVERGVEGTTAATHSNGATVTHVLTKAGLETWSRESGQMLDATVDDGDTLTIPAGHQMIVGSGYAVEGDLVVDGELVVV